MLKSLVTGMLIASLSLSAAADFEYRTPMGMNFAFSEDASSPPSDATSLSCGHYHCVAISGGTVWSIGRNTHGQLGVGDLEARSSWTDTGLSATSVVAGLYQSYALSGSQLWATGMNDRGGLGLGHNHLVTGFTNTNISLSQMNENTVSGGNSFTYLIQDDGNVWVTGRNGEGCLGLGGGGDRYNFTNTNIQAVRVAAGGSHGYLMQSDGSVWAAGNNWRGQTGLLGSIGGTVPTWADTGIDATDIAASWDTGYAISNGSLLAVGRGNKGQTLAWADYGNWTDTGFSADNVVANGQSVYTLKGGTIWSAGWNNYGQLGRSGSVQFMTDTGQAGDEIIAGSLMVFSKTASGVKLAGDGSEMGDSPSSVFRDFLLP
ncbi:RCC1 domain-containing protein [Neptuniibacter sp. QD37_11]|uniref:RCC1 domain-containing protein n=1 Tax=Neptuniibacter sp. QD37_11 TaxID=3398209 RepID=UPI0039F4F5AA